jgi:protein phosphatase
MAVLGARTVRDDNVSTVWKLSDATRPFLAGVLDGLGGHQGGDLASATVAARLTNAIGRWALDGSAADQTCGVTEALNDARRELEEFGRLDATLAGCGTTCTALVVGANAFVLVHVGDTRCYRRRDGLLKMLTVDQAVLASDGSGRTQLTHAIGAGVSSLPPELVTDLTDMSWPGDVYLLISDGVLAAAGGEAALTSAFDASDAQGVVDAALANGGPDNASVVRMEILE